MAEFLKLKFQQLTEALDSLREILTQEKTAIIRDATIQRFEYSVEAFLKLLKTYLSEKEGLEVYSPKEVMREARNTGLLSDEQLKLSLAMIEDRNKSTHLYGETMADEIYENIKGYFELMEELSKKFDANDMI